MMEVEFLRFLLKVATRISCITTTNREKIGDKARDLRFFFSYVGSDV